MRIVADMRPVDDEEDGLSGSDHGMKLQRCVGQCSCIKAVDSARVH